MSDFEPKENERAILRAFPYRDDPDLSWTVRLDSLPPYDGQIPSNVIELARRRRSARPA